MYIKNTCKINDKIEIEKHYHWNCGAPGKKRSEKSNKTPEAMAKQNIWKRKNELRRLLELNFKGGDLYVTLTCRPDQRPDMTEALKVIRKFRDKLANEYKKRKWIFKYVITTEIGSRGAVHWNVIVNYMQDEKTNTWKLINKLWERGRPHYTPMDEERNYGQLADYIIKETSKRIAEGKTLEKLSYICSRNMVRPVIRKKKVDKRSWLKTPKIPKGYELVPDTLRNGINPYNDLPYQHYTIRKVQDRGGGVAGCSKSAFT